jgi:hypothetical protein
MITADLLVGTERQPTHSRRSQQTDALMVLAWVTAVIGTAEPRGLVYAACCCSATVVLMNSAMLARVG